MCARAVNTYRNLLRQLGAEEIEHYGRSLLDHLEGTYELLRQWSNPEEICIAGLFHSVYGTERLSADKLVAMTRAELKHVIGQRSERLVFLFCVADRAMMLTENTLPPYQVVRRDSRAAVTIDPGTLSALMEIGAANLVEQTPYLPPTAVKAARAEDGLFQGMQEYLSAPAGRALFICCQALAARHADAVQTKLE